MPQTSKKGPTLAEAAAEKYANRLEKVLRADTLWRSDACQTLEEECCRFVSIATSGNLGLVAICEYERLVKYVGNYLYYRNSEPLTALFCDRVGDGLGGIADTLKNLKFSPQEEETIGQAIKCIGIVVKKWKVKDKVREE